MNYPELLSLLYAGADPAGAITRHLSMPGAGAVVFLPEGYRSARTLADVTAAFLTLQEISEILFEGHPLPADMEDLLRSEDRSNEFMACIVEDPDSDGRRPIHCHRIIRIHSN